MEIFSVAGKYEKELISFLNMVEGLTINQELIDNASIIYDGKILGTISYEAFGTLGLIRYFIFKKEAEVEHIIKLIESVNYKAKENRIDALFSMVNDDEVYQLFLNMGFVEIDNTKVYIEEESILNSKYKNTKILIFKENNLN